MDEKKKDLYCPLLSMSQASTRQCKKEECAWWMSYPHINPNGGMCAIKDIADTMNNGVSVSNQH